MAELNTGPHAAGTFCWCDLATKDIDKAKGFYADVLGLESKGIPMPGDEPGTYTMWVVAGGELGGARTLAPEEEAAGVHSFWGTYIAVEDVDAIATKTAETGGAAVHPPFDIPGVGRMAVLKDPQGAVFCVWNNSGPHFGKAHFPEDQMGTVCWNELVTDDPKAAAAWYGELLGWSGAESEMGGTQYTIFSIGEMSVGGLMAKSPDMGKMCSAWVLYFLVPDADAAISKAEARGGKAFFPPMAMPGVGRFTWLADDQGGVFGILEPPRE